MSFIDTLKGKIKSLIGKKTDIVVEESKLNTEVPSTPVMEQPSEKVEVVIAQATTDLGNISDTTTTTENN